MLPRFPNWLSGALRFWSSVPLIALASVYAEGFYTAYHLGHLPRLCRDNSPNDAIGNALCEFSHWAILATVVSPIVWLLLIGLNRAQAHRSDWRVHTVLYTFGWGLVFGLGYLDPGGIISWWMD